MMPMGLSGVQGQTGTRLWLTGVQSGTRLRCERVGQPMGVKRGGHLETCTRGFPLTDSLHSVLWAGFWICQFGLACPLPLLLWVFCCKSHGDEPCAACRGCSPICSFFVSMSW